MSRKRPEILAPVGTWEMCLAAVHSGADAIYVGMPGFNARGRAETLTIDTLAEMISYCHLYGVKVFLAFNVLIFEQELESVVELLQEVLPLQPDALIVQDIGLVRVIKEMAPQQVVHASTQMTISSVEAIEGTKDLDIARYVLARELSLDEIKRVREGTKKEIEVFVHGALCVSYSGQCLTSESVGGRSANRGQCAQSCRLAYDLIVDGEKAALENARYLVSPKDLCTVEEAPLLQQLGVDSFKIEGRLKAPEYVASTSRTYRKIVDPSFEKDELTPDDLKVIYSRDFFSGWMHGVNHQRLVRADFSSHFGLEIGKIERVESSAVVISSHRPIKNGEGLLFFNARDDRRSGSPIYDVQSLGKSSYRIELDHALSLDQLSVGDLVFLNSSPPLEKAIRSSFSERDATKRIPLSVRLHGAVGAHLEATLADEEGNTVVMSSEKPLEAAKRSPLNEARCREEFSALSATPYRLSTLNFEVIGDVFLSDRDLRRLRQNAVQHLSKERLSQEPRAALAKPTLIKKAPAAHKSYNEPTLSLLLRDEAQLEALAGLPVRDVYLDFEYGKEYECAIEIVRSHGMRAGIATTRILKPQEKGHLKYIERLKPDLVLVRNLGALQYFKDSPFTLIGDFSLNITNSLTADWFFEKGISLLTPSYDLNQEQLVALIENSSRRDFEVTIHQYMPAFHMEHCVFAAFLSKGTSWRDCGKPCEKHRVELRSPSGTLHPLKADAECRNTMFNGEAQSAARLLPQLLSAGVANFRFEALFEPAHELREKVSAYHNLLLQQITTEQLFQRFHSRSQYGVSDGQLLSIRTYKDRKKEGGYEKPPHVSQTLDLLVPRP